MEIAMFALSASRILGAISQQSSKGVLSVSVLSHYAMVRRELLPYLSVQTNVYVYDIYSATSTCMVFSKFVIE